jgi:hypothetical protein
VVLIFIARWGFGESSGFEPYASFPKIDQRFRQDRAAQNSFDSLIICGRPPILQMSKQLCRAFFWVFDFGDFANAWVKAGGRDFFKREAKTRRAFCEFTKGSKWARVADLRVIEAEPPQGGELRDGGEVADLRAIEVELPQGGELRDGGEVADLRAIEVELRQGGELRDGGEVADLRAIEVELPQGGELRDGGEVADLRAFEVEPHQGGELRDAVGEQVQGFVGLA